MILSTLFLSCSFKCLNRSEVVTNYIGTYWTLVLINWRVLPFMHSFLNIFFPSEYFSNCSRNKGQNNIYLQTFYIFSYELKIQFKENHLTTLPRSNPSPEPHQRKINDRGAAISSISNFIICGKPKQYYIYPIILNPKKQPLRFIRTLSRCVL